MSSHTNAWALRTVNQHRRIPSIYSADSPFNILITWKGWLVLW
jgi:hypothetical protein